MTIVTIYVGLLLAFGAAGVGVAWWIRRRTQLSIRNAYVVAVVLGTVVLATAALGVVELAAVLALPMATAIAASGVGRGWRLSDLGAGEELRAYENRRRWLWQPRPPLADGERRYIAGQGQVVHERPWPADEPYVPLTRDNTARVPRADGRHIASFGGTGAGKTTSVLRAAAGRVAADNTGLLVLDQKGDEPTLQFMQALAAKLGRPFVLFDPRAKDTDRWQPLWGDQPDESAARLVSGIKLDNPYYGDLLRQHVTIVLRVMYAAGHWPPSVESVVSMSMIDKFDRVAALAKKVRDDHPRLWRKVEDHRQFLSAAKAQSDLAGGLVRLDLVGEGWADVLEPRVLPDGRRAGITLPQAMDAGALVLWRTWADAQPDTAAAITSLALADVHAAAQYTTRPWTVILDEVAAVMDMAADPTLALLQRGRSHGGQVFFVTQSVADIEAITGQTGLLESLTDNFSAFIVHRQTSPASRDWLAKLMGTIALWGSTDQTTAHGASTSGAGTRRRVREFRVSADRFGSLGQGQAIVLCVNPPADPIEVSVDRLVLDEPDHVPRVASDTLDPSETEVTGADPLNPTDSETQEAGGPQVPVSRAVPRDYAPRRSLRTDTATTPASPSTARRSVRRTPELESTDSKHSAPTVDGLPGPDDVEDTPDLATARTAAPGPARRTRKGKRPARSTPREDTTDPDVDDHAAEPPATRDATTGSTFDF